MEISLSAKLGSSIELFGAAQQRMSHSCYRNPTGYLIRLS